MGRPPGGVYHAFVLGGAGATGEMGVEAAALPALKGPTKERAVAYPAPGDPPFACRKEFWFNCAA